MLYLLLSKGGRTCEISQHFVTFKMYRFGGNNSILLLKDYIPNYGKEVIQDSQVIVNITS